MKRVISHFMIAAAAAAALVLPSNSFADAHGSMSNGGSHMNGDHCNDSCDGIFSLSADLLILQPCGDFSYARTGAAPATETVQELSWDYELGFRVNGMYANGCNSWDIAAGYTYFNPDEKFNLTGADTAGYFFIAPNDSFGAETVTGDIAVKYELDYQDFEVVLGHSCCLCDGFQFRSFAGFKGLMRDVNYDASYTTGTGATVDAHRVEYDGYGMIAGFTPVLNLADSGCKNECWDYDMAIIGRAAASLVAGEEKWHRSQTVAAAATFDTHYDRECVCAFGYDLSLGFSADSCYCNTRVGIAAGYEFQNWDNLRGHRDIYDAEAFGLHGFFVRGHVQF